MNEKCARCDHTLVQHDTFANVQYPPCNVVLDDETNCICYAFLTFRMWQELIDWNLWRNVNMPGGE